MVLLDTGTPGTSGEIYSEDGVASSSHHRHPHCKFLLVPGVPVSKQTYCTSRMRSQPQLRNNKHNDTIHQLDKL